MAASPPPPSRLASLDAYRGFVMLLMLGEVLRLGSVARAIPESEFWKEAARQQSHVEWIGCTLHDLIQPSFSFLVGVALPFSIASRRQRGQPLAWTTAHAFLRAAILVSLGIFLRSLRSAATNYTFEDTLTQIGLGYFFLYLIGLAPRFVHWLALAAILVGYWAAFATHPLPAADYNWKANGVSEKWASEYGLDGFQAHWNKNANLAHDVDVWFLNLFPRQQPFAFNGGGYQTLSFVPTLATMILGLIAGTYLRGDRPRRQTLAMLAAAGAISLGVGLALGDFGIVPVVKRIWTPSWVLYSGGWCLILLAGFYGVIDVAGWKAWAYPLVVVGANSIVAYCLEWLSAEFFGKALVRHLGPEIFRSCGPYEPLVLGACVLAIWWLILFWMHRNRVFVRI